MGSGATDDERTRRFMRSLFGYRARWRDELPQESKEGNNERPKWETTDTFKVIVASFG